MGLRSRVGVGVIITVRGRGRGRGVRVRASVRVRARTLAAEPAAGPMAVNAPGTAQEHCSSSLSALLPG